MIMLSIVDCIKACAPAPWEVNVHRSHFTPSVFTFFLFALRFHTTSDQALLLFCRKALKTDHPTDAFKKLSNEFVDYIDGHPLALEVFGRSLRDRKEDYWSTKLKSLKDNNYSGEEKIIGVLKASFDGLENQEQKDMFLDTACFFKGEDVCRLEKIFESCGYYPSINIDILCEKYLVSMVGGKLWMHDLLQKMGRDIVRGESKKEGERSRLWHHTVALPNVGELKIEHAHDYFFNPPNLSATEAMASVEELYQVSGQTEKEGPSIHWQR